MNHKKPAPPSDLDRLEEAQKSNQSPIVSALFIGFLIGIIVYSLASNTWGFFTLIPLFLLYKFLKKPN
jgi:hypothetical protein